MCIIKIVMEEAKIEFDDKEKILFTTQLAKRRLIFRWIESAFLVLVLLTIWLVLTKKPSIAVVCVVLVFFVLFFCVGIGLSLLLRKNTRYAFTKTELLVRSGVFEIIETRIAYKDIVCYKKHIRIPDALTKKQTATFKIYKVVKSKRGKKRLVQDMVCSMHGVKMQKEIEQIFQENKIAKASIREIANIKRKLREEWNAETSKRVAR